MVCLLKLCNSEKCFHVWELPTFSPFCRTPSLLTCSPHSPDHYLFGLLHVFLRSPPGPENIQEIVFTSCGRHTAHIEESWEAQMCEVWLLSGVSGLSESVGSGGKKRKPTSRRSRLLNPEAFSTSAIYIFRGCGGSDGPTDLLLIWKWWLKKDLLVKLTGFTAICEFMPRFTPSSSVETTHRTSSLSLLLSV